MATSRQKKKPVKKKPVKKKVARKIGGKKPPVETPYENMTEHQRSITWQKNHDLIISHHISYVKEHKRHPTYQRIAVDLGLNEKTVRRHFAEGDMMNNAEPLLKNLRDQSLLTIAANALKGEDVHWSRLFHEIMDGKTGKKATATITPGEQGPGEESKGQMTVTLEI